MEHVRRQIVRDNEGHCQSSAMTSDCKGDSMAINNGKYVWFTPKHCPKLSSQQRQQVIHECPILSNIEPKQIKVRFQNRRLSPQRKTTKRVPTFNTILTTSIKEKEAKIKNKTGNYLDGLAPKCQTEKNSVLLPRCIDGILKLKSAMKRTTSSD